MKKKEWICYAIIIFSLIISIFAFLPINKSYKVDPWMSKVSNNTRIKDLSIPGTHDSGAMHSLFDVSGKCQDLSIIKQLDVGVRFFDIRLQLVDDELNVVHSFVDQELKFEWVLNYYKNFLKKYDSEFIIMSIKEDADSKNSAKSFNAVNSIRPATSDETLERLMHQLYLRGERSSVIRQLALMDALVNGARFFLLSCNISDEAAKIAYEAMRKDQ